MRTVVTIEELRERRGKLHEPVGLIPTMGYLHKGHIALVQKGKSECASIVVSIFVNPTQFNPSEDLSKYPRDIERDKIMLEAAGVDLLWIPTPEVMYPSGYQTWVNVEEISKPFDGKLRPGHFRGVTTVVAKLFNAVQPQKSYFGQKDAQQALIIKQMAIDLNFPMDVVICPTIRELDGLAMSSRNTYLNPEERKAAGIIYQSLSVAKNAYKIGERNGERLCQILHDRLTTEPAVRIQYVACVHPETLQPLDRVENRALLLIAAFIGKTRLIDNIELGDNN
jgi:pantoate--beta-alanine ligase